MAFARLAPHCGLQPVYGSRVGNSDMRGGFSWSNFGASLSSGLSKLGSFISSSARKIGNSQAFQQAKSGILQSGVLENIGQLAGQAVSSLVDVGKLKVESDLQKLRDRVLASQTPENPPMTQEQLAQLVAAMSSSKAPVTPAVPVVEPLPKDMPATLQAPPLPAEPVTLQPVPVTVPNGRRKRRRPSSWGTVLDGITGDGVRFSRRRYCY
ncbi:pVI [Psittacine adenovirus 3]|uniref:PVI n=1 Tax=Psittacine adenovirus 3 TaxID=1580497 RepID=A0A0A7JTI8_9ADEN|nr:pVI [Psittacine adenovirus 3]AIZ35772.1 pVI [Psittacine adenovirus 3]